MKEFKISVLEKQFGRKIGELSNIKALDKNSALVIATSLGGKLPLMVTEVESKNVRLTEGKTISTTKPETNVQKPSPPKGQIADENVDPKDWLIKKNTKKNKKGKNKSK